MYTFIDNLQVSKAQKVQASADGRDARGNLRESRQSDVLNCFYVSMGFYSRLYLI